VRAGQPAAQALGHQVGVFGRDEIRQPAVYEVDAVDPDETRELAVGIEDHVAMH
jgi:hypothetical protein